MLSVCNCFLGGETVATRVYDIIMIYLSEGRERRCPSLSSLMDGSAHGGGWCAHPSVDLFIYSVLLNPDTPPQLWVWLHAEWQSLGKCQWGGTALAELHIVSRESRDKLVALVGWCQPRPISTTDYTEIGLLNFFFLFSVYDSNIMSSFSS